MPSESRLRTNIVKALTNYAGYWIVVHQSGTQEVGLPDIIGVYAGIFYGIEVKMPGKLHTVTERQAHVLAKIEKAGGRVGVVTTVEQALDLVFP